MTVGLWSVLLLSVFYTLGLAGRLLRSNIRRKLRGFAKEDLESMGLKSQPSITKTAFLSLFHLFSCVSISSILYGNTPFLVHIQNQFPPDFQVYIKNIIIYVSFVSWRRGQDNYRTTANTLHRWWQVLSRWNHLDIDCNWMLWNSWYDCMVLSIPPCPFIPLQREKISKGSVSFHFTL